MNFSIRTLMLNVTYVAIAIGAWSSDSELFLALVTLFFVILILRSVACCVMATENRSYWLGSSILSCGLLLTSPYLLIFDAIANYEDSRRYPMYAYAAHLPFRQSHQFRRIRHPRFLPQFLQGHHGNRCLFTLLPMQLAVHSDSRADTRAFCRRFWLASLLISVGQSRVLSAQEFACYRKRSNRTSALSTLDFGVAECVKHFGEFQIDSKTESLDGFRYLNESRESKQPNPDF